MGAVAVRRVARGHRSARHAWVVVLLLLVAVFGPQLVRPGTSPVSRAAAPVAFGSPSGDGAVVAAVVRPTTAAVAQDDQRPHHVLPAAVIGAAPTPPVVVGGIPDLVYGVRPGTPVERISRGPPVEA